MASTSSLPVNIVGGICVGLGINCLISPRAEYTRFGLPLEPSQPEATAGNKKLPGSESSSDGAVSPLMYMKGIRELTYGIALIALQYQGLYTGVTTFLAVCSLAGLGDGIVIWFWKDNKLKSKAFSHWSFFVAVAGWAAWRTGGI